MSLLVFPSIGTAAEYQIKVIDVGNLKTLESFKSVDEFEKYYRQISQHCLDQSGGGSGAAPCFVAYNMWDRELNFYYEQLMKILGKKEKALLRESQFAWIKERDKTIDFNSALMDKIFTSGGTMDVLMRADFADETITPIVKQRALLLKKWKDHIKGNKK